MSHGALLVAVQVQSVPDVTATLPVVAVDGAVADSGEIENAQPGDCLMATGWPAIVTLPERAGPVVEATPTLTVPLPLPDERPCREIQLSLETADHSHSAFALTVTGKVPPPDPICPLEGWTTYEHPCDWMTTNGCPATTAVPVRERPVVAAAANATDAGPLPDGGLTVSQATLLAAVHGHAGVVVIAMEPFPPEAGTDCEGGAIV